MELHRKGPMQMHAYRKRWVSAPAEIVPFTFHTLILQFSTRYCESKPPLIIDCGRVGKRVQCDMS